MLSKSQVPTSTYLLGVTLQAVCLCNNVCSGKLMGGFLPRFLSCQMGIMNLKILSGMYNEQALLSLSVNYYRCSKGKEANDDI